MIVPSPPDLDNGHPLWFVHVLWGWGMGLFIHSVIVTKVTGQWWPRHNASFDSGVADLEGQQ